MRRFLLLAAISTLAISTGYSQSRGTDNTRQLKSGEVVQLSDGVTAKITKSTMPQFADVKLKGQPVVVVLELDAGKKGATLLYTVSADSKKSEVHLAVGTQRIAPSAVIEDFPSWGADNDKEVEILDPAEKSGSVTLTFEKKGSVAILFDVPADQSKAPQKFFIKLRTVSPNDEQHSFVVSL